MMVLACCNPYSDQTKNFSALGMLSVILDVKDDDHFIFNRTWKLQTSGMARGKKSQISTIQIDEFQSQQFNTTSFEYFFSIFHILVAHT